MPIAITDIREYCQNERIRRNQSAAVAEMKRNGIAPPDAIDLPSIALNAQATTGKPDFVSRPDAKPMSKRDRFNVALLTREDAKEILDSIRLIAPGFVETG